MKKIGIIIAVELRAFTQKYGEPKEIIHSYGNEVMVFERKDDITIYALRTGAGEIAAAMGTMLLITEFHVDAIFNFGVVGGLTEEISHHRLCVVKNVVHYGFDVSQAEPERRAGSYIDYPDCYIPTEDSLLNLALRAYPKLKPVTCASSDKFVGNPDEKIALYKEYGAEICEMEAAGIAIAANKCKVPCLMIKTVADGLMGGEKEFREMFDQASEEAVEILDQVITALSSETLWR